jgi:serine phosphatase RsbU (regulator of sigma subunit)
MTDAAQDALVAQLRARLSEREGELEDLRSELGTERLRLERELAFARRVQLNLMPHAGPVLPGWSISTAYRAARTVGGDFYDVYELPDRAGTVGLVVADVTGKGITAALMMAFSRAVLRAAAYNGNGPEDALRRTNRVLVEDARTGLFLTAFVAELDPRTGLVRYAIAGHEPPMLLRSGSARVTALAAGGEMLGIFETLTARDRRIELRPGDTLVVYTDGVTDARDARNRLFGEKRLRDAIMAHRDRGAVGVVAGVLDAVDAFAAGTPAADDVTLLAIGREPTEPG